MLKQNQSPIVKVAIIISAAAIIISLSYLMGWKNCYRQFVQMPLALNSSEQKNLGAEIQSMPVAPVLPTSYKN